MTQLSLISRTPALKTLTALALALPMAIGASPAFAQDAQSLGMAATGSTPAAGLLVAVFLVATVLYRRGSNHSDHSHF